ncbi:MAG: hypothetical protein IPI93_09160 [Sphingobacteriaceae bacterium]|nr:hypothetical protein [Sphingobacteriaceae bacterium]MBK7817299.1 hypothetical protein [Sphingobacteriaceae bacterium]
MAKSKKPSVKYRSERISVFDSVAEQEASSYQAISKEDPVKRIKETVKLILKVYGYTNQSLKSRKSSNKITFES